MSCQGIVWWISLGRRKETKSGLEPEPGSVHVHLSFLHSNVLIPPPTIDVGSGFFAHLKLFISYFSIIVSFILWEPVHRIFPYNLVIKYLYISAPLCISLGSPHSYLFSYPRATVSHTAISPAISWSLLPSFSFAIQVQRSVILFGRLIHCLALVLAQLVSIYPFTPVSSRLPLSRSG